MAAKEKRKKEKTEQKRREKKIKPQRSKEPTCPHPLYRHFVACLRRCWPCPKPRHRRLLHDPRAASFNLKSPVLQGRREEDNKRRRTNRKRNQKRKKKKRAKPRSIQDRLCFADSNLPVMPSTQAS
jgi:hypothetical protein